MPKDKSQPTIPIHEIDLEQTNEEEIPEQYLDESDDDEDEDDDDEIEEDEMTAAKEELEHAYQCDFTKRAPPPPCPNTSLLSNLLSNTTTDTTPVKQNNSTKRDYSAAIGIRSTLPNAMVSEGQLSESLKRNLAREHSHSSLRKYKNIKRSSSFDSLTDNFSRY